MKLKILGIFMFSLLTVTNVEAKPRHWYKDWKWWMGEAVIAGAFVADGYSTSLAQSRHAGVETNPFLGPHPSNRGIVGLSLAGFSVETAMHAACWHYSHDENKGWRIFGYTTTPTAAAAVIGRSAAHNFSLADKAK
jgi:hypothetical protein